jgi:hypothetical protein
MKLSAFLMALIGLTLFSCNKNISNTVPGSIEGSWQMIVVADITTNTTLTKPLSIQKDVVITFVPNSSTTGTFTGKTPSNDIWQNDYSLGVGRTISIPVLSMTKVGETTWGAQFVDNIRNAQQYSFENAEKLNITTTNKILTFKKL